jgi:phenylacetate-CoA ligase
MHTSQNYTDLSVTCLESALASVPGYSNWQTSDPGPNTPIDARYAALPTLTKQHLRNKFPTGFIPNNRDFYEGIASGEIELAQTSGSTDDKVTIVFHPIWWEASERAAWQLNTRAKQIATGAHREVVIASPRCVGPGFSSSPLPPSARTLGRHLYLNQNINPASWSDDEVRRMADELAAYEPLTMEGDPAYLAAFAHRALHLNLSLFQPRLIFLTYSYPSRLYRRRIQSVFTAPQISSYGSTETGHVFLECEAGRLHQNVTQCRVDFEPWHPRHGPAQRGRLLVSVFHNPWFAVLRFDVGDVARLDNRGPCPCGRHEGLTLASIDGRTKDVSFAPDGHPVTVDDIDASLAEVPGIEGWQLDLDTPTSFRLRLLVEDRDPIAITRSSRDRLRSIYGGNIQIFSQAATELEHEVSGKFRFVRATFAANHDQLWRNTP